MPTTMREDSYKIIAHKIVATGPDGGVVMSSAYGLVDTGIESRHRFQPRAGF